MIYPTHFHSGIHFVNFSFRESVALAVLDSGVVHHQRLNVTMFHYWGVEVSLRRAVLHIDCRYVFQYLKVGEFYI
jgi:hypothetical protein